MLLRVCDLLIQPKAYNQSTLNPCVGCVQLFFSPFDFAPVRQSCSLCVRPGHQDRVPFFYATWLKGLCVGRNRAIVSRWGMDITMVFLQQCNLSSELRASSPCSRCVQPLLCTSPVSRPGSVPTLTFPHWYQ